MSLMNSTLNVDLDNLFNDFSHVKCYMTKENLIKKLVKENLIDYKPMVIRTPEGKWTAIFAKSFCPHGNFMFPIWKGFKVIG